MGGREKGIQVYALPMSRRTCSFSPTYIRSPKALVTSIMSFTRPFSILPPCLMILSFSDSTHGLWISTRSIAARLFKKKKKCDHIYVHIYVHIKAKVAPQIKPHLGTPPSAQLREPILGRTLVGIIQKSAQIRR